MMWFLLFTSLAWSKVDPPNYDFSVDSLAVFMPGAEVTAAEAKHGKAEVMSDGDVKMLRFQVVQIRYKFPVIVQAQAGKVIDMHATLPSYFLHDIFHHSLIKRYGKQQTYKRVDEEAFYEWKDADKTMQYGASCTITCFPVYFSVAPAAEKAPQGFKSLREQLLIKR